MPCPRCQHENRPGAKFCEECGLQVPRRCGHCGAGLSPTAKFCSECGRPDQIAPAPRFSSPESYTPRHLAEKILISKAALEGERKQVTVLFADMKGSMELLADRDPEEARNLLDPVLERMMEAVHRYEGTVNQVMGDGIMALFGAPLAHEDHAVRACYAALRMQDAVSQYSEETRRSHGVNVQIRVGLNSGEVVVRSIGSDLHMDYTAVGQTTHMAARMEQLAAPGATLLTGDTLRFCEGYVEVKPLGPMPVKGLSESVEVYEITGAGSVRTRFEAGARRGLTRFVGRDRELEQLRRVLQLAGAGHGQVAGIIGEAGVGKSRLVYEFIHSYRLPGWLLLESASVSYGRMTSYLPVIDLLKDYFEIQDRDDLSTIREKVTGKVLALDRALEPTLPALLALLDVTVDEPAWASLDPAQRRQRTLDAVKRILLREARERPLLVVFEDLHWIDHETQALLDSLVESLGSTRLLLLVNYRPEYQHAWGRKTYYNQMRLDTLPAESAAVLLDSLLGADLGLAPLKQLLVKRGNPFFLEESIRTLVETKALAGERGRYRLTQPVQGIQVPATVQAILAARIDRLPAADKYLLQTASVIGKDVPFALIQAIADLPAGTLRRGLGDLQAAEFLYETSVVPEPEYTFKHALTHDVAYASLLHERRRALHARIAEAIEQLYPDRLAEQAERLAHHALHGETWPRAVRYGRHAGTKAAERSANRESVGWFEKALLALGNLPETRETLEQAVDIRFELRNALFQLGELERMRGQLAEAERLTERLGDRRRLGWVTAYMSQYFLATARSREAREFGERAYAMSEILGDFPLQIAAGMYLGQAWLICDCRKAEEYCRRVVQMVSGDRTRERRGQGGFPAVTARAWLTLALAERGEFQDGLGWGQEALLMAEALDHPFGLVSACWALGYLHGAKGELDEAVALLKRAVSITREWNLALLSPIVSWFLGLMYARAGRIDEGLALLHGVLKGYESAGIHQSPMLVHLGEACLLGGRLDEAFAHADRALALTRERGQPAFEAWALRLLGEIASRQDPPDVSAARTRFHQALAAAGDLDLRPLSAHCHLGLSTLYRRADKPREAQQHLTTALALYRDLDMRSWLAKAEGGA